MSDSPLYTLAEAAKIAHLSRETMGLLIRNREVPGCSHVGCRYVIPRAALAAWLNGESVRQGNPFIRRVATVDRAA